MRYNRIKDGKRTDIGVTVPIWKLADGTLSTKLGKGQENGAVRISSRKPANQLRTEHGLYPQRRVPVPPGHRETGGAWAVDGDEDVWTPTTEAVPDPEAKPEKLILAEQELLGYMQAVNRGYAAGLAMDDGFVDVEKKLTAAIDDTVVMLEVAAKIRNRYDQVKYHFEKWQGTLLGCWEQLGQGWLIEQGEGR